MSNYFSRRLYNLAVALFCSLFFFSVSAFSTEKSTESRTAHTKRIVILQLVEHPALNATRKGIEDTLKRKGYAFRYESAQGNPALATQIAQQFVGLKPDVMVGIPTIAAQALVSANLNHNIPIVFSSVTDPLGAKLVQSLEKPGSSVTGVSNFVAPDIQIDLFKQILPKLTRLGVIYNPGEPNSVALVEQMQKIAKEKGMILITAVANTTADVPTAAQNLMSKVDAIFINNDNTALSAFESIVKIARAQKIPVFCSDTDMVMLGALAALGPSQYDIGKQTGEMVISILEGKSPKEIPVAFPLKTELHLNLKMANELNITIPGSLVKEATQVIKTAGTK